MTHRRAAAATALAAAALLALTACGDSADDTSDSAASAETSTDDDAAADALEQAVRDYTEAYFAPDADTAYDLLSERCQAEITATDYATVVAQAATTYGHLSVESLSVDELSGGMARVTYSVGQDVLDADLVSQPWTRESGEWKYDAC